MADQNKRSRRRRRSEPEEAMGEVKRSKEEVPEQAMPTIKITDVNTRCLEAILMQLEFIDLFNVADANSNLRPATGRVFAQKYGNCEVNILEFHSKTGNFDVESDCIYVTNETAALKLLRYFGEFITKLNIHYTRYNKPRDGEHVYYAELDRYVFEYCSRALTEIKFSLVKEYAFSSIKKPLPSVESVSFDGGKLNANLCDFTKWFPNLRHLRFGSMVELDPKCVAIRFPHLESLSMMKFPSHTDRQIGRHGPPKRPPPGQGINEANAMKALSLNPQLKSVGFAHFNTNFLRKFSKHFQNAESLELVLRRQDYIYTDVDEIQLKNVKRLSVKLPDKRCPDAMRLPFDFGRIEEFTYESPLGYQTNDHFCRENPLKKVHLKARVSGSTMHLAGDLPSVTELVVDKSRFRTTDVIEFVTRCKKLTKFHFTLCGRSEYNILKERLGNKWHTELHEIDGKGAIFVKMER